MNLLRCPFCGIRDETEFHFATEAGKPRPEPAAKVSGADWAAYLHHARNRKGPSAEVWVHLTCGEFFVMDRDTASHEVRAAIALQGGRE